LWLNSPDLDAFSFFYQLRDTTSLSSEETEILAVLEARLLRKSKAPDPENSGGI
jgi:hypothetical protein